MGVEIHIIKRNGKLEYRCGNNTSDSYNLSSIVEEPFSNPDGAIRHMVEWQVAHQYGVFETLSHPEASKWSSALTKEQAIKEWHDILREIQAKKNSDYIDLDDYVRTVNRISKSPIAGSLFLLGDKEVDVLKDTEKYLMTELTLPVDSRSPSDNIRLPLFEVTIDKLTDYEEFSTARPNPNLKPNEVTSLNQAARYISHLEETYTPRRN